VRAKEITSPKKPMPRLAFGKQLIIFLPCLYQNLFFGILQPIGPMVVQQLKKNLSAGIQGLEEPETVTLD
jgi:hypothetical protein